MTSSSTAAGASSGNGGSRSSGNASSSRPSNTGGSNNNNTTSSSSNNNFASAAAAAGGSSAAARSTLSALVQEHVTGLLRTALVCQRHAKRARLHQNGQIHQRIHAADINMALQIMGSEKLYGLMTYGTSNADNDLQQRSSNNRLTHSDVTNHNSHHRKVELTDVLQQTLPPAPSEVKVTQHWLAVDGVIPEAVITDPAMASTSATLVENDDRPALSLSGTATAGSSNAILVQQLQAGLLSHELGLYYQRVVTTLQTQTSALSSSSSSSAALRTAQDAVLRGAQTDSGLQELVPFLVRYCQQQLYSTVASSSAARNSGNHKTAHSSNASHTNSNDTAIACVRLANALLSNPTLHLELHLHELIPALVTCVVTNAPIQLDLRSHAGRTLALVARQFGNDYATLQPRLLTALSHSLSGSLGSKYGGVTGIALFGVRAIDAFLLPVLLQCHAAWEQEWLSTESESTKSSEGGGTNGDDDDDVVMTTETPTTPAPPPAANHRPLDETRAMELTWCLQAALQALAKYLREMPLETKATRLDRSEVADCLGDRLVWLEGDPSAPYNMCFI